MAGGESKGSRRYDKENLLWQFTVAIRSDPVGSVGSVGSLELENQKKRERRNEFMTKITKVLKRLLAGTVIILVLLALFFKEIALFVGCVVSCLFVGFYDFRAAHEEIMKGDFAKGEIKVWKVNEETVAKNALELESDINKWKCSEHAPCYKVADIFVPLFGVIIGDLTIHITEDMVFYIYSDFNGVHNYGRFLDESDKRLKKCLESGLIRHQSHRGAIEENEGSELIDTVKLIQ